MIPPNLHPMSTFNPARACRLYDELNDDLFRWDPGLADHYRLNAQEDRPGVVNWDGLLLAGWLPAEDHGGSGSGIQ